MARMTKKDKEFFEKAIETIYNDLRLKMADHRHLFNNHNHDITVKVIKKFCEFSEEEQEEIIKSPCWKSVKNPYIYLELRKEHENVEYLMLKDKFKNSFKSSIGRAILKRGKVDREFREFLLKNAEGTLLKWLIQTREIHTAMTTDSAMSIFNRVKNASILKKLIKIAPYDSVVYGFKNYKGKDKSVVYAFRAIIGYSDVTSENALSFVLNKSNRSHWEFVNAVYDCGFASKAKQKDITALINFVKEKEWDRWHIHRLATHLFSFCTKQTIYSNLFFFKTNSPESLSLKLDL
jgi:hypothetical protein